MQKSKYLIAALMTLGGLTLSAQTFQSEGLSYKVLSAIEHTVQLTASNAANPTEVNLPDTVVYEGIKYALTSIGENAFSNNNKLVTVTLPATLRDIQYGAFFKTLKLRTINAHSPKAPDIEASPFATTVLAGATLNVPAGTWFDYQYNWRRFQRVYEYGTKQGVVADGLKYNILSEQDRLVGLTGNSYTGDVNIPATATIDGKEYKVVEIGCYAFDGATSITSVTIPATVLVINNYAFRKSSLPAVTLPQGLRMLKEGCFEYTPLTTVTIPQRIQRVENLVFAYCDKMTEVTLGDSVNYLGNSAFGSSPKLQKVHGGDKVTLIMESVFLNDTSLTTAAFPNVVTIKGAAFRNTAVKFTFPKSLKSIDLQGFMECRGLTEVVLPDTMDLVGSTAFASCPNMTKITFPKVAKCKLASSGILQNNPKLTEVVLPQNITAIPMSLLAGCTALTTFTVPSYIKELKGSTFMRCTALKSVKLPEGLTAIGGATFSGCSALTGVDLPESITSLGGTIFLNCTALRYVKLPSKLTALGAGTFNNCTALDSVTFGPNIATMGQSTFLGCSNIKRVILPEKLTMLPNFTFKNCTSLDSVYIPRAVASLGNQVFNGCSKLPSVTLRSNVSKIGTLCFVSCTNLKTLRVNAITPPTVDSTTFDADVLAKTTLVVRHEAASAYRTADVWKQFNSITLGVNAISAEDAEMPITIMPGAMEVPDGAEVYNLYGMRMNPASLAKGIYIVRYGRLTRKVMVP